MSLLAAAIGTTAGALGAAGLGRLRENRRATGLGSRAVSDLLGWGFLVGEGVVLMKDGSFLAAWRFRGRDLASSTAGEVAALAEHVNTAIASYGDGWMVHVDAVRRDPLGDLRLDGRAVGVARVLGQDRPALRRHRPRDLGGGAGGQQQREGEEETHAEGRERRGSRVEG